ncbi:MAG: hypothetical protein H6838_03215 [Planctomycetes bacterium]|nr:hypothetical protein [Planctomycetota bacterium]
MSLKSCVPLLLAPLALAQNPGGQVPGGAAQGAPQVQRSPMLIPQAVILPLGGRELTIDGSLSDWPELPALRLDDGRQISGTGYGAWHGPEDLGAVVFLVWDKTHLYVAAAVKDEWHRALDAETLSLTEVPAADSVVLSFDPERDTRANGNDPGRREDREFWLADEPGREVVQWDRLRGTARVLETAVARAVVLHDKEHGLTTYEARIPWSEILPVSMKPQAGLVFDMQIVVNDFDESTDPMPQTRIGWTFGCGPVVDPGLFGSAMLVADAAALQGKVPEFPAKPSVPRSDVLDADLWRGLTSELLQAPPVAQEGTDPPELVGGTGRLAILEKIDDQCAKFPRVDYLELNQRINRRMSREVAGICARGLPSWWRDRLVSVSRAAADPVPNGTARLFRLPMGGWLVRTSQKNFAVDAAGPDLAELLWGGIEFCILTQPLDVTRRNDQLLMRMFFAKPSRPVLTHIAFHLPVVSMNEMPLVEPGQSYGQPTGAMVRTIGSKLQDGSVTWSCSYRVEVPAGPTMLFAGNTLRPEEIEAQQVDLLVISPRNPSGYQIVAKVDPGIVVLDDGFLCQALPNQARVTLRDLHSAQRAIQPRRSVILAPGESWDVPKRK